MSEAKILAAADRAMGELSRLTILDTIEACARMAEQVPIPHSGHPQIDAPTVSDARLAIATAIRALAVPFHDEKQGI